MHPPPVELIRQTGDGLRVDRVKWGWAPFWAKGKRPDPINARAETVMTGKFFKALWPVGRALAPANGWFEWTPDPADPKRKQPYYITAANNEPLFFAAWQKSTKCSNATNKNSSSSSLQPIYC